MHVKVDEDLPLAAAEALRASGYHASTVVGQSMGGWKDPPLWEAVQAEGKFFITGDKGFGDIRTHPPGGHAGVLVLRPDEDGIDPVVLLLERVLAHFDLRELEGTLAVATPRGLRIRRTAGRLRQDFER